MYQLQLEGSGFGQHCRFVLLFVFAHIDRLIANGMNKLRPMPARARDSTSAKQIEVSFLIFSTLTTEKRAEVIKESVAQITTKWRGTTTTYVLSSTKSVWHFDVVKCGFCGENLQCKKTGVRRGKRV